MTIGRLEDNLFQISEASISSHHCEIHRRGNDLLVKDLDSTNGTFINGKKVAESTIKPGQILRLGQVEIRLETKETAAMAASNTQRDLEQTRVMSGGVKINELAEHQTVAVGEVFQRQSNKVNTIFIWLGVTLGVVIVGLLIFAFLRFYK